MKGMLRRGRDFLEDVTELSFRLRLLKREVDALKSSLDTPAALAEDFRAWRGRTPLPERPLVSVCIATYNRADLLVERAVASILAQSYDRFELIVVGDGCTDHTTARMAEVADPRVTFVNLPERGAYPEDPERRWMVAGTQAVNHAMHLARGDLITHLDDDDEHLPRRLELLVRFLLEEDLDFVWHPFWYQRPSYRWRLNDATEFAYTHVTTSSVLYRSWFRCIEWNPQAHLLMEPGDWGRFRRIRHLAPRAARFPEPLLRHYRERSQKA
jgi:glycosyltransferase involved in cell wall biosynthesis